MEGTGALVSGLGGASPNPVDGTATDLPENSSEFGNGSTQLSVDDLAINKISNSPPPRQIGGIDLFGGWASKTCLFNLAKLGR